MTTSTTPTATTSKHNFDNHLDDIKPSKVDINHVIMDYLINEGYPSAARKFAIEANIPDVEDPDSINERVEIRNAIHKGDIRTAIECINELNPEILDSNSDLHFALLRLQLVELIRACLSSPDGKSGIEKVIEFATYKLAPRAPENPEFIEDLEKTLALLLLPPGSLTPPFSEILDPKLRRTVANKVNEAILSSQGDRREARIRNLVRLRAWAEASAKEAKKVGPQADLDLRLDGKSDENVRDRAMTDVHNDPAITG